MFLRAVASVASDISGADADAGSCPALNFLKDCTFFFLSSVLFSLFFLPNAAIGPDGLPDPLYKPYDIPSALYPLWCILTPPSVL